MHDLEAEFLEYASIVKLTEGQEMTPAEIAAAIAGLKNGIDLFKSAASAKDAATNSHFVHVISSMELQLSNLETEIASKNRELIAKNKEVDQLREQLAEPKEKLVLRKISNYWYSDEDTENPVCKACYDSLSKTITLSGAPSMIQQAFRHKYICPACKTTS